MSDPARRMILNRPVAWLAAAFVLGTVASSYGLFPGLSLPIFLLGVFLFAGFCFSSSVRWRVISILAVGFCTGAILWQAGAPDQSADGLSEYVRGHSAQKEFVVEGRVRLANLQVIDTSHSFCVDVDSVVENGKAVPMRGAVSVRWYKPNFTAFADDRVRVAGLFSTSFGTVNPGISSYESYMHRQGIFSAARCKSPQSVERLDTGRFWSLRYHASRLRLYEAETLKRVVAPRALAFVQAIWLGYGSTIETKEYETYLKSGTVHILSVSGIHMVIVFVAASFVAEFLFKSRRRRAVFVLVCILLFTATSGVRASALRSAVMIVVYIAADLFDRERDAMTALGISALLLVGIDPPILFDVGFQLSFLSVASMLLFGRPFNDFLLCLFQRILPNPAKYPRLHNVLSFPRLVVCGAFATSLSVQILPTPLAISVFHVFPIGAPLANLIVVPLSTAALWLSCTATLAAPLSSLLASLPGHALGPVVRLIQLTAIAVARPRLGHWDITAPSPVALVLWYVAAGLFLGAIMAERRRVWVIAGCIMAAATVIFWSPPQPPEVVFLDVGHGDAIFVRSPAGKTALIDGGDLNKFGDTGRKVVLPFLRSNHVSSLDCVMVSHPDSDHIGGLLTIVDNMPIKAVVLGTTRSDRPLENKLIELCGKKGIPVQRLGRGQEFNLGGMKFTVLHPPATEAVVTEDVNDQSLVVRLDWGGHRFLFAGDIELAAEQMVGTTDCAAEVLKVPHHGSRTSSSPAFIRAVHPKYAVISTGGETGREPVDRTIAARYRTEGIEILRTDLCGGITVRAEGGNLVFQPTRPMLTPGRTAPRPSVPVGQN